MKFHKVEVIQYEVKNHKQRYNGILNGGIHMAAHLLCNMNIIKLYILLLLLCMVWRKFIPKMYRGPQWWSDTLYQSLILLCTFSIFISLPDRNGKEKTNRQIIKRLPRPDKLHTIFIFLLFIFHKKNIHVV